MTDLNDQWHVSLDDMDEYFEGKLSSQREAEIDTHFADCSKCTEIARELRQFSAIWNQWTAHAHGQDARTGPAAAVMVNFNKPDPFVQLPGFPMTPPLFNPAANSAEGSVMWLLGGEAPEYGDVAESVEIDLLPTGNLPPGAKIEALDLEKTITVVIPCQDKFAQQPPRIELISIGGKVLSQLPEQKSWSIRERAGDPDSFRERECWVASFEGVPLEPMVVLVTEREPGV